MFMCKEEGAVNALSNSHLLDRDLTFSRRSGSPLHREFTDTLNDFQAGLKLFITTWEEKGMKSDLKSEDLTLSYFNIKTTREATAVLTKRTSVWNLSLDENLKE